MQSPPSNRLVSLDAFRGFVMLLMASSAFGIPSLAKSMPDSWWPVIATQFSHRDWTGCALWDLIQPSFMFMVGVAMAYSYARRGANGDSFISMLGHAITRSLMLIFLAVLLTSNHKTQTEWAFTNVLGQIGLGYVFLFILWRCGWEVQASAVVVIIVGYWWWFAWHPAGALPAAALAGDKVGAAGVLPGFFSHWSAHVNAAADVDRWLLNLFPRSERFEISPGGYQTLNFIPSLATMTMGLLTGRFLHLSRDQKFTCARLVVAGVVLLMVGSILGILVCPIVKRIWTPSWALFSTGWVLLMLAAFYWLVEIAGQRKLVFPLVVVGMNSIFIYVMHSLCAGWIKDTLKTHFGKALFTGTYAPMMETVGALGVLWLLCFWLYRQKVFLRL